MFLVLATVHLMVHQGEAVDCTQVRNSLMPCVPYLIGKEPEPADKCCSGVSDIKSLAQTTKDCQDACECVKAAAAHIPIDQKAAAALPNKCHIDIGIPISPDTDCQQ
ncbi:hypothetical protein ACLB2K_072417 [Fragaria x ananassa]